jgi:hypothetical protein
MHKGKIVSGLAVLVLVVVTVWQVTAAYIANAELQEDMRDLAAQVGMRIGLDAPASQEQLRQQVLRRAESYDIELKPEEVTVQILGAGKDESILLTADYTARIRVLFFSFGKHFSASSKR